MRERIRHGRHAVGVVVRVSRDARERIGDGNTIAVIVVAEASGMRQRIGYRLQPVERVISVRGDMSQWIRDGRQIADGIVFIRRGEFIQRSGGRKPSEPECIARCGNFSGG